MRGFLMTKFATDVLQTQKLRLFVCFRYIDDVFFTWNQSKEKLKSFMK